MKVIAEEEHQLTWRRLEGGLALLSWCLCGSLRCEGHGQVFLANYHWLCLHRYIVLTSLRGTGLFDTSELWWFKYAGLLQITEKTDTDNTLVCGALGSYFFTKWCDHLRCCQVFYFSPFWWVFAATLGRVRTKPCCTEAPSVLLDVMLSWWSWKERKGVRRVLPLQLGSPLRGRIHWSGHSGVLMRTFRISDNSSLQWCGVTYVRSHWRIFRVKARRAVIRFDDYPLQEEKHPYLSAEASFVMHRAWWGLFKQNWKSPNLPSWEHCWPDYVLNT